MRLEPPTPTRRAIMKSVKQRDTAPEMLLRRALWRAGLRFRVSRRVAGVRPDISFGRQRVAIYVDGCFWHGCPRHYTAPKNNAEFWAAKLRDNRERDERDTKHLQAAGWTVLRFWACEIVEDLARVVASIDAEVRGAPGDRGSELAPTLGSIGK